MIELSERKWFQSLVYAWIISVVWGLLGLPFWWGFSYAFIILFSIGLYMDFLPKLILTAFHFTAQHLKAYWGEE